MKDSKIRQIVARSTALPRNRKLLIDFGKFNQNKFDVRMHAGIQQELIDVPTVSNKMGERLNDKNKQNLIE